MLTGAWRTFLIVSEGRGGLLTLSALLGKRAHLVSYSSESSGENGNKKSNSRTWLKHKRKQTAKSLLNDVSISLHPNGKQRRWETREEINKYIRGINDTTAARKNDIAFRIKGGPAFGMRTQSASMKKNKTFKGVDMDKVKEFTEILENSKERLGLFDPIDGRKEKAYEDPGPGYKTAIDWWDHFEKERVQRCETLQPKNHYQEMLGWSQENKFPSLPIDNEVGMEEEQNVPFHKHVFLDELLEDGFPKQGPIRKFMEAVILGLSKNPYLSVQEKEEHVQWFREYFNEKVETLRNLGLSAEDKMIEEGT